MEPELYKPCPCGSGEKYKFCCKKNRRKPPSTAKQHRTRALAWSMGDRREWIESPFHTCRINADWRSSGLANFWFLRGQGDLLFGTAYLVDLFGLGLKDCFTSRPCNGDEFRMSILPKIGGPSGSEDLDPELARSLVWGGVHYAQRNGFRPPDCHPQCVKAIGDDPGKDGVDPSLFGDEGKVHIVGDWESIRPRMVRSMDLNEAMEHWDRRGFHFSIGGDSVRGVVESEGLTPP